MSLERRIAKIENLADRRCVSDDEYDRARALFKRNFDAIYAPKFFGCGADPNEVALMRAAEESGEIARAEEVIDRWKRAHGIDPEAEERRSQEWLRDLIAFFSGAANGGDPEPPEAA